MIYDDVMKQKRVFRVEIHLKSGEILRGIFFIQIQQRPLEILNDDRKFIPFRKDDGEIQILNKDIIAFVLPIGEPELELAESATTAPALATASEGFDRG